VGFCFLELVLEVAGVRLVLLAFYPIWGVREWDCLDANLCLVG